MTTSVFVEQLYTKFLGRASDSAGKSYWAEQIDSGSLSASEATQLFLDSPEFADIVSPIAQLYYTALGRIPDAAGLEYWIKDYRSGTSMEAISSAFVQSPEFTSTYGNLADNSEFLEQLYQNTFNRASDQDGKLYWQTAMDAGMSRAKVVNSFANSKEFINAKGNDIKVLLKYHGILGTQPSQNDIDVATAAADPISLITQLYTNDSYTGEAVPGLSTSGVVIDGYVSGATVFIDANGNGIQDSGEASTTTDKFGNFDFAANAGFGNLIMTGGTDISTGKPFEGSMTAPGGSTVVNPLTTLIEKTVQAGTTSVDEAITNVLKSLGLDSSVDLLNFDPIKEAIRTDTDTTKTDIALAIQATAVQVNTLIGQTAALLDGAGVSANEEAAIDSAYSALAASLADTTTTETVDLASSTVIETVIQGAAVAAGADSSQRATVATLSTDATQTISNLNQAIDTAVTGNSDISSTLTKIAAIQIVAEDIEEKMETGAATGDVSDTTTSTDNTVLTNAVDTAGADVGDVTGDGTSDATETTPPPSGGGSSTPSDTTAPADLTSVTIPDSTMKIGSTVTTTITASETGLTLKAGSTIGGFALSNLTDNSNNTYTAQFIVTDGGTDVAAGTDIAVNITLVDAAGNESSAFTTAIAQTSDTIDANTPVISGSNPADDATAVAIGSNIVLTFNEAVAAGTGNIVISDGSDTRTIAVGDAQVTISGNTVTINPTTDLNSNSNYNVLLASGVINDAAGNAYAGITDTTTLNFSTVDTQAPTLSSSTPADDATAVAIGSNIVLTFNEAVAAGTGNIIISDGSDTRTIAVGDAQVTISGNTVTINPTTDLNPNSNYNVLLASGVINDAAGNAYAGITDTTTLNFSTVDTQAPTLSSSTPADDATAVAIGSNIVLTFNEAVAAGTGNIVISDGSDTRTIAVGDTQVTISENTVTINPTTDLNPNSNYNVQLASGVFTDSAGNAFAGITEATTLDFLTVGVVADGLISGATVFRDTNDNGVLDGGEVSTTTNANGEFSLGGSGTLVAKGGTDTLTGLNFEGFMKAESGGVLNPLTSFLNSSLSATQLLTSMNGFMGLDTSAITDIANFDPTALLTDGDTSNDALGIVTQNIAVQMLNVVDLVANKVAALVGVAAYEARAASIIVDQLSTVLTTTNMANLLGGDGGTAMTSLVSAAGTAIATDLTTLKTANNTTYGDLSSVDITAVQTGFGTASATMISSITAFATSMAGASTASTSSFIEDMVLKQIGAAVEAAGSSDAIAGTFAADTLASSGSGNSVLLGGTGADTITLSATADTVAFLSSQDGGAFGNNTGYDTINNFQTANDKLTICFVYEGSIGGGNHNRTVDVASVNSGALDKNSNDKEIFVLTNTTENNLTDLSAIIAAIGNVTSTDNDQFIVAINNVAGNQAGVYAIDTSGDNNGALLDSTEIAILGIVSTDSALTAGVFTDFGSVVGLS